MTPIEFRSEISERLFVFAEERSFHSRAKVDRDAGLWIAARLGLGEEAATAFAARAIAAGVRSATGRGGFDHLATSIERAGIHIEELRTRYAIALAAVSLPPLEIAASSRLAA